MSRQSSALLDYEPHTNLSINMKTANECRNLSELRYEIDTIDHFIVKLVRNRMDYALATLKFKLDEKPIPDNGRIIQQLNQREKWAEKYGLDPKFIESLFKSMIDWYMSQQIAHYKTQHPNDVTSQFKICSLPELKAIEFGLSWIDVSHYAQLLSSGYRKGREITKPILVSYTQKAPIFSDNLNLTGVHPFSLFEQAHHLSLSHGFLFAHPSQQFFMLAFGSAQQFDIDQNILHFSGMDRKVADLTLCEFHSEVKEVVEGGWRRLLLNGVIEKYVGRNFCGNGPVLNGGLCFDHQSTSRSEKWSGFSDASFVLPRVQFSHEKGDTYITFNTVITSHNRLEQEMQLIDAEIISLLKFCHELLKRTKQYADNILNLPIDDNNYAELNRKTLPPSDTWKQTVDDAIVNITNIDLEKIVLVRETEIQTGSRKVTQNVRWSLTYLCSLYPSSYVFGVLRQENSFFGAASAPLVRLFENQLEVTALTSITMKGNDKIEDKTLETGLFNSTQQRHEHSLMIDFVKNKLQPIIETNSLVVSDESVALKLPHPQHLHISVRGKIRTGTTVVDIIQTLHPTLTVTGFPQSNALKFIREKENLDRGWFAAPIGWIDAHNNGEFIVSSTAALINEHLISLFAGCDIVAHSDSEDKLEETMLFVLHEK